MSRRLAALVALAALALAACATPRASDDPGASERLSDLLLAPLNVSVRTAPELDGKLQPVWDELLRTLHATDRQVSLVSVDLAEAMWLEACEGLDLSDRTRAFQTASSRFARLLAEHRDYDGLVVPSLVLRTADLQGVHAAWDGVRRLVPGGTRVLDSAYRSGDLAVHGLSGKIAAASLHVAVYRPDGSLTHEGLGGLDLIQEARREGPWEEWTFALRSDPFADAEHLREGVDHALGRPLQTLARGW